MNVTVKIGDTLNFFSFNFFYETLCCLLMLNSFDELPEFGTKDEDFLSFDGKMSFRG